MSHVEIKHGLLAACDSIGRIAGVCMCRTKAEAGSKLCVETEWPLVEHRHCLIVYDQSDTVYQYRVASRSSWVSSERYSTYLEPVPEPTQTLDAKELRELL